MKKAFVSWSGGKDCCQAAHRAVQQGFKIACLLNMVTNDKRRSCSHGLSTRWIRLQAEAIELPLLQQATTSSHYEAVYSSILRKLKSEGVNYGIFGDIDFEPHREWITRVCSSAGIMPILPLWQEHQEEIARKFIDLGFEAVVVATQADLMGEEWLGRKFDEVFLKELSAYDDEISPCGEAGEFHTIVVDGPLFKKRLQLQDTRTEKRGNHWYLEIKKGLLVEKSTSGLK
jgi:diphthine-ammonia ligase